MKVNGKNHFAADLEINFQNRSFPRGDLAAGSYRNIGNQSYNNNVKSALAENINPLPAKKFLQSLLPSSERVFLETGDYVYKPGEHIKYIYFPESAILSELQILEEGETIEIAMIGKKEIAGIQAIFGSAKATNWINVSFAGSALKIRTELVRREVCRGGAVQTGIFESIDQYFNQISQRAVCNAHHNIEKRLSCWLLMLYDRCRNDNFAMTQEQLAHFLGVYRPSITHAAQFLRDKEIIKYSRGKISILNRAELEKTSCSCYTNIANYCRPEVH